MEKKTVIVMRQRAPKKNAVKNRAKENYREEELGAGDRAGNSNLYIPSHDNYESIL